MRQIYLIKGLMLQPQQNEAQQYHVYIILDMLYVGNFIISYYFIISYARNDSRDLENLCLCTGHPAFGIVILWKRLRI